MPVCLWIGLLGLRALLAHLCAIAVLCLRQVSKKLGKSLDKWNREIETESCKIN